MLTAHDSNGATVRLGDKIEIGPDKVPASIFERNGALFARYGDIHTELSVLRKRSGFTKVEDA